MHRVLIDPTTLPTPAPAENDSIILEGDEARHLTRARRANEGDKVEALDAAGARILATIESIDRHKRGDHITLRINAVSTEPPMNPSIEVWSASPKGDRLAHMIEELSQVGVALWQPILTERSVVEPRDNKIDRLRRIARESIKQCGRAWAMEIAEPLPFDAALTPATDARTLIADPTGQPLTSMVGSNRVRILIGPEGGWSDDERARARSAAVEPVRVGRHIMRIETAAVVAAGLVAAFEH
ncbi:MAG: hypothetical protein CMJ31_04905 [Phycisphaerae bacterium]|nr:hypothetical protein [Phycisphaerae bacterium]